MASKKPTKKEIAAAEELVALAQAQLDAATAIGEPEPVDAARAALDDAVAALAALTEGLNVIPTEQKPVVQVRSAKGTEMWHPFQNRYIPIDLDGVEVVIDGWIECQIEAGVLEIVK